MCVKLIENGDDMVILMYILRYVRTQMKKIVNFIT